MGHISRRSGGRREHQRDRYKQPERAGARMGDAQDALRSLSVADIQEMQYLSAADATMRFGTNFVGGAIVVTSRSR